MLFDENVHGDSGKQHPDCNPEASFLRRVAKEDIFLALSRIPDRQRIAFTLF